MLPRCASSSDTVRDIKYKSKHLKVRQRLSKRRRAPRSARSVRFIDAHPDLGVRAVAARLPKRRQAC
jgi:hypothetical protein